MPPRRIGFDAIRALRNSTGLGNYARHMLRGLHHADPAMAMHLYAPAPFHPTFENLAAEIGGTSHAITGMFPSLRRTFQLGRMAQRDGVSLFHGLSHEIPRDLPATGIPSLVSFADLIFETHPEFFPFADRFSYQWRYRWSAEHANAIVAISEATRLDLIRQYALEPERITVVPPARSERFASPIPADELAALRIRHHLPPAYLLSVGTLETRKNHAVLLDAVAALSPTESLPLVLVGRDGGELARLQAQSASLGLADRVRFLTNVSSADLPGLMRSATIFVYPSRVEGFGMPIVEALTSGVPVVASAGGCFPEAGGPLSRYARSDAPEEWSAAISSLLADPGERHAMAIAGAAWAQQFDGDRLARRMLAVYDAILAGNSLPASPTRGESAVTGLS